MAGEIPDQRRAQADLEGDRPYKEWAPSNMGAAREHLRQLILDTARWARWLLDHGVPEDEVDRIVVEAGRSQPDMPTVAIIRWQSPGQEWQSPGDETFEASTWDDEVDEGAAIARQALAELRSRTEPLPQGI